MGKKRNKSILVWSIILMALVLLGGSVYFASKYLTSEEAFTGNLFVKPLWARLECAPTDSYEGKENIQVPKSGISIYCGLNENTDHCNIYATNIPLDWKSKNVKIRYQECNIDGSGCDLKFQTKTITEGASKEIIKQITAGRKLFVYYERSILNINVEGSAGKEYKVWQLYRIVGGSKSIARSKSCSVSSNLLSKIPSDSTYPDPLLFDGGEGSQWINYVDDWAIGYGTNVFKHPRYGETYCSGAQIYDIVKLQFKDGHFEKLDPTYKGKRQDQTEISGLGKKLANVECCPNEPTCGADFKYKSSYQGQSCVSDIQCPNAGNQIPKSSATYVTWSCIDKKCIESSPVTVECTTSTKCPSGQICDLSRTNYGKCIQQSGSPYCGDNKCQVNENALTCPSDCINQPVKGLSTTQLYIIGILALVFIFLIVIVLITRKPNQQTQTKRRR